MPATSNGSNPDGSAGPRATSDVSSSESDISRRLTLKSGAGLAVFGVAVAAGAGYWLHRPDNDRQLVFGTLADAMREVERLAGC